MKFAEHLSAHITPEWRKQYIQYEQMKEMLYEAVDSISTDCTEAEVQQIVKNFDKEFFSFCEKELQKINSFFAEKLAEAQRKFIDLKNEIISVLPGSGDKDQLEAAMTNHGVLTKTEPSKWTRRVQKKINDLKLAFSEFYLNLVLLQNYQTLNFTGFRKILKKHDKLLNTSSGLQWRLANVDKARFYTCKDVDKMIEKVENIFTNVLEDGNRSKAMKRLRVPPLRTQQSLWTTFRVGFFSGVATILCFAAFIKLISSHSTINLNVMVRLFRAPFYVWLFTFLLGVNVYGWRTSGVNHVLIFELDPRDHINEQHLFEVSFLFSAIWALFLLGYAYAPMFEIDGNIFPLLTVLFYLLFLINPTKTCRHTARFWLLRVLFRVLSAPFFPVTFADFWLADQMNSLAILFADSIYYIFYYGHIYSTEDGVYLPHGEAYLITRAFATALPAWYRFAQCLRRYHDDNYRSIFPHAVNAGKYSTTFFVITFSTLTELTRKTKGDQASSRYFYFWIASLVISSLYTYAWDVWMDWGLMDIHSTENFLLRNELVYPKPFYHLAYVGDFFGRTLWALTISLNGVNWVHPDWLSTIASTIELFRRFVWNFFRLENEHLNNCGEFRAVRDISITPITIAHADNGAPATKPSSKELFKKHKKPKSKTSRRLPAQYSFKKKRSDPESDSKSGEVSLLMDPPTSVSYSEKDKDFDKL